MKSYANLSANPDIRRRIALRSYRIVILSLVWIAVVTAVEYLFLHDYFLRKGVAVLPATVIWLVLYLIGLLKIGLFPWLFDVSWEGELVKVKYRSYVTSKGLMLNRSAMFEQTDEILKIRMSRGGTLRRCIPRDPKLDAVIYKEGDLVRYYRGTKYPLILKRSGAPAPWICVFCSDVQPYPERTHCDHCGMSLIEIRKKTP